MTSAPDKLPIVLEWSPMNPPRGTLLGFARVGFPSGLILNDVALHANSGKIWASPPSKPWIKGTTVVIDEATSKPKYLPVVDFQTHGVRRAWSEQVIKAMRAAHPDALPPEPDHAGAVEAALQRRPWP